MSPPLSRPTTTTSPKPLLARGVITCQILLLLCAIFLSFLIPQHGALAPQALLRWQKAHSFWLPAIRALALDHIFTSPWFALLLLLLCITLALSTWRQGMTVRQKFSRLQTTQGSYRQLRRILPPGYRPYASAAHHIHCIKNPWGYWGNTILHGGMLVLLLAAFAITLSQQRGVINLVEGEQYTPDTPWSYSEQGLFHAALRLPFTIDLQRVFAAYWPNDNLRQLACLLNVKSATASTPQSLAVGNVLKVGKTRLYLSRRYGTAFFLTITGENRRWQPLLELAAPGRRDQASYGDLQLADLPVTIQAKFYADKDRQTMDSLSPILYLRLKTVQGIKSPGPPLALLSGQTGQLGPYTVTLLETKKWVEIIAIQFTGYPLLFLGFFLLVLGGGLRYLSPPREILLVRHGDRYLPTWNAGRFRHFYQQEFDRFLAEFRSSNIV